MIKELHVKCTKCGYETDLEEGTFDAEDVLVDFNEDYADYEEFECEHCKKFYSMNVNDPNFDNKCTRCNNELKKAEHLRKKKCIKCEGDLEIREVKHQSSN